MNKAWLLFLLLALPLTAADRLLHPAPSPVRSVDAPNVMKIVGLRPLREGGIRLESELRNGVWWIHDYGHGGAGITLSWGTAEEAIFLAGTPLRAKPKIVVLGGGVIGLTTAWLLLQAGHEVTIYADRFYPDNVSNVAGGLWSPVSVDIEAKEADRWRRIQVASYRRFEALAETGWPVHAMPMFVTEEARHKSGLDLFEALPGLFVVRKHARLPIEGVRQGGYEVSTFLIETPVYMSRLLDSVKKKGATLVQRRFASQADVESTVGAGAVVFNCTGLGAGALVGDTRVKPVRGDLLHLYRTEGFDPGKIRYMAFYGPEGTDYMFPHPTTGRLVLGGTFLEGNASEAIDEATCRAKLNAAARFFGWED